MFGIRDVAMAPYTVTEQAGKFEIRQYPSLLVAQTRVTGDDKTARGVNFNRLFDYISGANAGKTTIAMTAPVLQEKPAGEPIAMTAPVFMVRAAQAQTMSFVLPQEYTLANAPKPTNPDVTLAETGAQKMAVAVFSGLLSEENIDRETLALEQWLRERRLKPIGATTIAGYDPPWTIPWWRRNEILIAIE